MQTLEQSTHTHTRAPTHSLTHSLIRAHSHTHTHTRKRQTINFNHQKSDGPEKIYEAPVSPIINYKLILSLIRPEKVIEACSGFISRPRTVAVLRVADVLPKQFSFV